MSPSPQPSRVRRAVMACAAGLALLAPTACTAAYGAAHDSDDRSTTTSAAATTSRQQTAREGDRSDHRHHHSSTRSSSPTTTTAGRSSTATRTQDANRQQASGGAGQGLEILGDDCSASDLPPHTGFQDGRRCVSTAFGEVSAAAKNPSLLIVDAPERVRVNEPFTITVSTRNLVRDRFLPAAQGGYYLESSFLNEEGIQRGHFHTACRMLERTDIAPDPAPDPAFFQATEDGRGGVEPDRVDIQVTGLPERGVAQCAVWAGDGSHRMPMMQRANQIPAFDSVRIEVR